MGAIHKEEGRPASAAPQEHGKGGVSALMGIRGTDGRIFLASVRSPICRFVIYIYITITPSKLYVSSSVSSRQRVEPIHAHLALEFSGRRSFGMHASKDVYAWSTDACVKLLPKL